jgi:hypothetical protein
VLPPESGRLHDLPLLQLLGHVDAIGAIRALVNVVLQHARVYIVLMVKDGVLVVKGRDGREGGVVGVSEWRK